MEVFKLNILDICFELCFTSNCFLPLHRTLKPFIDVSSRNRPPQAIIEIIDKSFNGMDCDQHLDHNFHSLVLEKWNNEKLLFHYLTGQMLTDSQFSDIKLWLPIERQMSIEHDGYANYNGDPSLRLAVWGRAANEGYCYIHGALVVIDGNYLLFIGSSGCGKTTLSGLAIRNGATRLTDEDPFMGCSGDEIVAYASPWPGIVGPSVPLSGKLHSIFYLRHSEKNSLKKLDIRESSHLLLKHSRTFNWLPATLPQSIDLFDRVAKTIPAYDFGFVPDNSAIEVIRNVVS